MATNNESGKPTIPKTDASTYQSKRWPKVLLVGPFPPPYGGIAVVVRDLVESPLSEQVDLRLMRSMSPDEEMSNLAVEYLLRGGKDLRALIMDLVDFRPDVVHIHTSYDWGWPRNVTLALFAKIFGAKVILHIHAYDQRCKEDFPRTKLRRLIYSPKTAFNLVDQVFTLSDKFSNNILKSYPEMKVNTIYNCIAMRMYLDSHQKANGGPLIVSYVGRLDKRKGVHELLQAIEKITTQHDDIVFKIVGVGPEKEYVEDWMKKSPASSAVKYLGFISEEEKIRLFKETDIFVLQSTNEGVPISILEAVASGCAIISTPVGSIADVVIDGKNGLMIKPESSDELVRAILLLYEDRSMLERMQNENLTNRLKYSWEEKSKGIAEIYTALARER